MKRVPIGTVCHGTLRHEDLIPAFADLLEQLLDRAIEPNGAMCEGWQERFRNLIEEARCVVFESEREDGDPPPTDDDDIECIREALFDALDSYAPPYFYFGAHPGDGADYGFWLSEEWKRSMEEDDVLFVDDTGDPRIQGHTGLVAHVNDHGNLSLYSTRVELDEVWAVV